VIVRTRALVGHADLLRVAAALLARGHDVEAGLTAAVGALGFERLPPEPSPPVTESGAQLFDRLTKPADPSAGPSAPAASAGVPFWQPITLAWHGDDPAAPLAIRELDEAEADAVADAAERKALAQTTPPLTPPLTPRSRLLPMLQRALTTDTPGRDLDVPALVRGWSRGVDFRRLPRLRRRGWPTLVLLLDRAFHLVPFWREQLAVRELLHGLVGGAGLVVRFFDERGPDGPAFDEKGRRTDLHDGTLAGLPMLALTDLGWYGGAHLSRAWLRLGRQLRRAGERILALVPVPPARWTADLTRVWAPLAWERPCSYELLNDAERAARASRVLDLAANARRLEPGLLRALRLLLAREDADVGTEVDAWMHEDMGGMCADATVLRPDRAQARRERFAAATPELRARVAGLLRTWHWHRGRGPELWHSEALLLAANGRTIGDDAALDQAQEFMARLGRRAERSRETAPRARVEALQRWLDHTSEDARALFDRTTIAGQGLQRAWGATHDPDDPPPDADPALLVGDKPADATHLYTLRQVGEALEVWSQDSLDRRRIKPGGLVASLWAAAPSVYPVAIGLAPRRVPLAEPTPIHIDPAVALELRTDRATLGLRAVHRPVWATAIGRDPHGLWVDAQVWGVIFRMRWIPPGRFLMGSPASEQGRWDDEGPQHEVVISHGYWLGDTPVTHALWQAVMDDNPSRFKDPTRPVEQVTWDEARQFTERLDELLAGGDGDSFRLPTEAEWEYACRAGTTTATYAGEIEIKGDNNAPILDRIAWYGGNSGVDYDLDEFEDSSSWSRKQHEHTRAGTRRVKQKLPNQWRLYDMLGNVWEWCSDAWHDYSAADSPLVDPAVHGSTGDLRVRRGGGWNSSARHVRAACRYHGAPDFRSLVLGLRLARGQGNQGPEG
jgi:formylglycine-generating enzyme required for sulfatase activity